VDLPCFEERKEIFGIHLGRRGRDPAAYDLDLLARESESFSGAEIEQVVISALYDAFYAGTELQTSQVLDGVRQTVPLAKTMDEQIDALRSWASGRARFASAPSDEGAPAAPL
jgi:SpoVK/Ycf46/Vps4 family AAA+-type ATPase